MSHDKLFKSLKQAPHGVMADGVARDAVRGFVWMLLGLSAIAIGALYVLPRL